MEADSPNDFPIVDYETHPAFLKYAAASQATNEKKIEGLIHSIDQAYFELIHPGPPINIEEGFNRRIKPDVTKVFELTSSKEPWIVSALPQLLGNLLKEMKYLARRQKDETKGLDDKGLSRHRLLSQHGFVQISFSPEKTRRLFELLKPYCDMVEAKARTNPCVRSEMPVPYMSRAWQHLKAMLAEENIVPVASAYKGEGMKLMHASLELAHEGQTWFKGCYEDVPIDTTQTVYLHYDYGTEWIKSVIYLSDVSAESGPFGVIKGSHLWKRSPFQYLFFKEVDDRFWFEKGKDYAIPYYRPRFKDPAQRELFMKLPKSLRGTSHFGDDVLDGSDLSRRLLNAEQKLVGPAGTGVLFDGSRTLHRGTLVRSGRRWSLQIGFQIVPKGRLNRSLWHLKDHYGRFLYDMSVARQRLGRP